MKIVVIGDTGRIGSKTVAILRVEGHEVVAGPERAPFNEIYRPLSEGDRRPASGRQRPRGPILGGGRVEERSLVPLGEARLGRIGLDEWLRRSQTKA
jgi:hypothetical protein